MAQRTIHYVLGQILAEKCGLSDTPRFLFGSLLPDAIAEKSERDVSHYVFRGRDGTRYYELERFFRDYAEQMTDALYIGYYLHLVEDIYYRTFFHTVCHFYFVGEEKIRAIHRDYHLLNPYLREKYSLSGKLTVPSDFDSEPIARLAPFDAEGLVRDFEQDLSEKPEGEFSYFTPDIMEEYIRYSLPLCEQELRAVLNGGGLLRGEDFAWNNNNRS